MTTVVVGGHSRKVGKTSVAAGLIRAFPGYPWTAIKISSHWHAGSPGNEICDIHEESSRAGDSDSSQYLTSGAARSYYIRVREGHAAEAIERLRPVLQSSPFLIIESNCILRHLQPDLYVMVLRWEVDDFKESARETLSRADALVVVRRDTEMQDLPPWSDFVREKAPGIPTFTTPDPRLIPPGLKEFMGTKLRLA